MKNKNYLLIGALISILGFSAYFANELGAQRDAKSGLNVDNEYQVGGILFHQKAAEYRALAFQAFKLARMRLDMDKKLRKRLPKSQRKKPRAIIVDVDETVLDNSPYFGKLIKDRQPLTLPTFFEWKKSGKSKAVPGSVEFLNYAKRKGVDIFYVSNVPGSFKQVTIENLKSAGFPDAQEANVMVITNSSSKEPRRQKVAETHRILMLIGDSLNDLSVAFERKSVSERFSEVDKVKSLWGTKFIVIPNVMYGAWESAIYGGQKLDDAGKSKKRIESLDVY